MSGQSQATEKKTSGLLSPLRNVFRRKISHRPSSPQPPQSASTASLASFTSSPANDAPSASASIPPFITANILPTPAPPPPESIAQPPLAENTGEHVTVGGLPTTPAYPLLLPTNDAPNTSPLMSHSPMTAPPITENTDVYAAIGGLPTTPPDPLAPGQRMKETGKTVYRGLIAIVQALSDCSDVFPPLKTACNVILTIHKAVDRVSTNRDQVKELEVKLTAILEIVKKYRQHGGIEVLRHRVESFCEAIKLQVDAVEGLHNRPAGPRIAESEEDAAKITKTFRNIGILCDVFQMDTQLNIEQTVNVILQHIKSGIIERLRHETTSYKTRISSYGDAHGCLAGTRVKILADLEAWALDGGGCKVYWLLGMAGTGKSTIAHTLCEILDSKSLLGASFFCSRASTKTNEARLIIPTIAHELASASPSIKSMLIEAIEKDKTLPESTYGRLEVQFNKLVRDPLQACSDPDTKASKVVVIDAVDECTNLNIVSSLIKLILQSASHVPLKIFIASRDEPPIRAAFGSASSLRQRFILHEVEKDVVQGDIQKFVETSLLAIDSRGCDKTQDVPELVRQCGTLFIYAATAIRYITGARGSPGKRLAAITSRSTATKFQASLDNLYGQILEQACADMEEDEINDMRNFAADIVFLRNPLPIHAIASLSETSIDADQLRQCLSPLHSVVHIPDQEEAAVTLFHASFFDFVTNPARCTPERCRSFKPLDTWEGHEQLTLKCLAHMNRSLKYNICDLPEAMTVSRMEATNPPDAIKHVSGALKYSCLHWAAHLAGMQPAQLNARVLAALQHFLQTHLLHWIECLSILDELGTAITSLQNASASLAHFKVTDNQCHNLQMLVVDACRCLQMNFEVVRKHCMEIYQSSLIWLPNESLIRQVYATFVSRAHAVTLGLPNTWGPTELVMNNGAVVQSVAFSHDGKRVISGSNDCTVRIWNAATGEVEAELKGHTDRVKSVAFSQDDSRVISVSNNTTIRIWHATTGDVEAELEGHARYAPSVAFSHDGSRLISASDDVADHTVRIWDVTTGEMEVELKGHTGTVSCVAFSQDSSRVVTSSQDKTVRIWNATSGEMEVELEGNTDWIQPVAFSHDGSRVVATGGTTIQVWNAITGEMEVEFAAPTAYVKSIAFSHDGNRLVSGSSDTKAQIWHATTGEIEAKLKGHTDWVLSVAFSQDGSRVVSGSIDASVRIWDAMTGKMDAGLDGSIHVIRCVAFSHDGSRIVSGSEDMAVRIWDAMTGEMEVELEGHEGWIRSVAFSQDDSRIASGSDDYTVRIWNVSSGGMEVELKGHTSWVLSVAFSQDGSRVVSGSRDTTLRVWHAIMGEVELKLEGHTDVVRCVAFSHDGSRIVSGSDDKTVRIWNVTSGEMEAELNGHTESVRFVAFTQEGNQVVSESHNREIHIWDATTGEMEVGLKGHHDLARMVILSLNSSRVVPRSYDEVMVHIRNTPTSISQPRQPLAISRDRDWILGTHSDCWIPHYYRAICSFSFSHSKVCFGYEGRRLVILDMAARS